MIFNQKKLELLSSKLDHIDEHTEGPAYDIAWREYADQKFARNVFLGYYLVDTWEGTPCVFMERGP